MVFGDNCLKIEHQTGFGLEFNALDALRLVDSERDLMKVACAEDWQKSRYGNTVPYHQTPFQYTIP